MDDLYTMSKADNIMYAKRCIVDSIYKQSRLEGIAVTFPETQEIYEGRSVSGLSVEDIIKVNNLKHGWQFIFDTIRCDGPCESLLAASRSLQASHGAITVPFCFCPAHCQDRADLCLQSPPGFKYRFFSQHPLQYLR